MNFKSRYALPAAPVVLGLFLMGCSATAPASLPAPPASAPTAAPAPLVEMIRGTVTDVHSMPIAGVLIQAYSGPEAYVTSDAKGEFSVPPRYEAADVFHASKEGYASTTRTLESGLNFVLKVR